MKGHGSAGEGRWGEGMGESGVRGNYGRDIIYKRRIKKKEEKNTCKETKLNVLLQYVHLTNCHKWPIALSSFLIPRC